MSLYPLIVQIVKVGTYKSATAADTLQTFKPYNLFVCGLIVI